MFTTTVYKGSANGKVVEHHVSTNKYSLKPDQVLVKITHSGLCGTDEHYKTQDMVLGHEGVGVVEGVGGAVKDLKIGDRVGWGYCYGSCASCHYCRNGEHVYCEQRQLYGMSNLDQGSFASHTIRDQSFLFKVPDSISSAHAAPLMCAGAAVYSALNGAQVQRGSRVGVLGVGGLGHLAIQFANEMGGHVVAISYSPGKEDDSRSFGASEFVCLAGAECGSNLKDLTLLDTILLAGSQQPDWKSIIPMLRRGGTIFAMTVDPEDLKVSYMDLVMNAISIRGSLPCSPPLHQEMLDFAATHKVLAVIESFAFTEGGINEAMEKLRSGKMRYRGVVSRD
ncbi:alcohol dehydrogenase [Colletotrichum kahawae]|uniref:Alcohol dehydrogenase n=1 Tax=Colletotrichum kahawae TaxID=34407 RepID=A0AAD9XUQ2_COLKA|nr:alcohol dehydrogenase [Colletotrichum kahawae]